MLDVVSENLSQEQINAIRLKDILTKHYIKDKDVVNGILECFNNNLSYQEVAEKVIPSEYTKSKGIAIYIVGEITRLLVDSKEQRLNTTAIKISNSKKQHIKDNPEYKAYLLELAQKGRDSQGYKTRSNEEIIILKNIIMDSEFKFRNDILDISKITDYLNKLYGKQRPARTKKEISSYINNIIKKPEDKVSKEPNRSKEEENFLINILNNEDYITGDSFKYFEIIRDFSKQFPNMRTNKSVFEKFSKLKRKILGKKEVTRLSRSDQELIFLRDCLDNLSLIGTNKYNPNAIDVDKLVQLYRKTFPNEEKNKSQIYTMLNKIRKKK